jgi:NAD-dependent DNA ligase
MPRKASTPAVVSDWLAPKFPGKTFALTGKLSSWQRERMTACIVGEGGQVIEDAGSGVDFLVVVPTPSGGLPSRC